jgi:hypothetical protein
MKSPCILDGFHKLNREFVVVSRQTAKEYIVLEISDGGKVVFADDEGLRKTVTPCLEPGCKCNKEYRLSDDTVATIDVINNADSCRVDLELINAVKDDILYWADKDPSDYFEVGQWVTYRSKEHTPNGTPQTELTLLTSTSYSEGGIKYLIGYTTSRGGVTPVKAAPWRVRIVPQSEIDETVSVVNKLHPQKGSLECN